MLLPYWRTANITFGFGWRKTPIEGPDATLTARVEFLQEIEAGKRLAETEAMQVPESFDATDILDLFFETTEVLESVYQAMIDNNLPEVNHVRWRITVKALVL